MLRKMTKRILVLTSLVLAISGCSRVQLAYYQLDWVIPYYLQSYVELSDEQNTYLEQQVEDLLAWHCSTQLTAYADLLRSANTSFQEGRMSRAQLHDYSTQIKMRWEAIMQQASPAIANLLMTASDRQVEELFAGFTKRNQDWLDEYNEQTVESRQDDYRQRMSDELERWFGPLQSKQQQALAVWSEQFEPLGIEGLQNRERWQARLRLLLAQRDNKPAFYAGIEELFLQPEALRSNAYQKRLEYNKNVTIELLYIIGKQLNDEQRSHIAQQALSYAEDFDQLACQPKQVTTQVNLDQQ